MLDYIAVAIGGALGALLRAVIYELFIKLNHPYVFALSTLTVNSLGSMLMGVAYFLLVEQSALPQFWKSLLITGLLGALTTFSTFSFDAFRFLQSGLWLEAVMYVLVSLVICLLFTWLGYQGVKWFIFNC